MFRILRHSHMAMGESEAVRLLEEGDYAIVSVHSPTGYPYGFPMSYVVLDGQLYFHCALVGHKMECLAHSEKVSFTVVGRTKSVPENLDVYYESVVGFGLARPVEGSEKERALMALVAKYAPGFEEKGRKSLEDEFDVTTVIRIEIEHLTGKRRGWDR